MHTTMILRRALQWLGFASADYHSHDHSHGEGDRGAHGHTHGVIDPSIAATERGVWAVKWSFVILAITAVLQLAVVYLSGSIALFADTIHNFGDAMTAVPLWFAFMLARRPATPSFTYGYGRVEDLAGVIVVLIILTSAIVAGYEAIDRLIHPQVISRVGWVAAAGVIGFVGNEAVALFRIKVGREINSAALIADGYHARTDGLTSLAVVLGAIGIALGFALADPIVGLVITVMIFGIVWQSAKAVFTRMLDGVDPALIRDVHHAGEHVPGIDRIIDAKARWLGHRLYVDLTVTLRDNPRLSEAEPIAAALKREVSEHMPAVASVNVSFGLSA
jgi:cation diffusion facilitator family transporter